MKPPIGGFHRGQVAWLLLPLLFGACSGTTQAVQARDIRVQPRPAAAVPYALGEVTVTSRVATFDSDYERANYARSLKTILQHANLFGDDTSKPYRLSVSIEGFSIPHASFAGFNSTLDVRYELRDATGSVVYEGLVQSAGADDTGSILGPVRQDRSRTRAVAENLVNFVGELSPKLDRHAKALALAPAPVAPLDAAPPRQAVPAELPAVDISGPAAGINFGRYHALVIGNEQYRHLPQLKTPAADATAVVELLRKDYGFTVRVLLNATRVQMVDALADLRGKLGDGDNLLIYYAGHGYLDREADRGYWLAVDAEPNSPANWVSNADITDALRAMRAKHVLIVADSCYSGTLTRDITIRTPEASDLAQLARKRARNVLTSGGLEPVSDVGGSGHSVFARAWLQALRSSAGVTDATSLFAGLRRQVLLRAEQTPQYGDVRFAGHDGGDFLFVREPRK